MASIRQMTLADLDAIDVLEKALFLDSAWSKMEYEHELVENAYSHYLVVECQGEIAGYCGYFVLYENAEVLTIGVSDKHQGKGYAKMMMEKMLEDSMRLGAEVMSLEVRASNNRAHQLYSRFGFIDVAIRPQYYQDGENAILMVKGLEVIK